MGTTIFWCPKCQQYVDNLIHTCKSEGEECINNVSVGRLPLMVTCRNTVLGAVPLHILVTHQCLGRRSMGNRVRQRPLRKRLTTGAKRCRLGRIARRAGAPRASSKPLLPELGDWYTKACATYLKLLRATHGRG